MTQSLAQSSPSQVWHFPAFRPHPLLPGAHVQTLAGRYWPAKRVALPSLYFELPQRDGDRLCVLESTPTGWVSGDPLVLLVHGLGGCARAGYVTRLASRLNALGFRCVRMNLRGAGAGFGSARGIYHSGRTEDVRAVADWATLRSVESPLALVGFSLGANLVLKLAAEAADEPLAGLDCVLAANPPLDLAACCNAIREPRNKLYDRNFVVGLGRDIERLHRVYPELGPMGLEGVGSLFEFDDRYTARRNGFSGAEDYYRRCSAGPLAAKIAVAGLVVHSADDPFIPVETVRRAAFPTSVTVRIESSGGHLGYLSAEKWEGDHRWLDACLAAWLGSHWSKHGAG